MQWLEADPLPEECQNCQEPECYNCDHAGKRWYLSEEDMQRLRQIAADKNRKRLQRIAQSERNA